jgi:O-methyltransferase
MSTEKVTLTGTQETMLLTLYGKALDSRRPDSILQDHGADEVVQRIDYDFGRLKLTARDLKAAAVRSKSYDLAVRDVLDRSPHCTVLHLGCGLDTRAQRLDPPATVRWYDVDLPDVIELRRRLHPPREGVRMLARSATDPHLLDDVPADEPVLVVAEGLTPYLRAADGVAMLRRITQHFPGGELLLDGYSRLGVRLLRRYPPVRATGAVVEWSIGDPRELERAVPGLEFVDEWWFAEVPEIERHYARLELRLVRLLFRIPAVRRLGRGLRYRFGAGAVVRPDASP